MLEHEDVGNGGSGGPYGTAHFRDGYTQFTDVEKIYLTGVYRDKYRYLSNRMERGNNNNLTHVGPAATYSTPMHRPIGYSHTKSHQLQGGHGLQPANSVKSGDGGGSSVGPGAEPNGKQTRRLRSAYPMVRLN